MTAANYGKLFSGKVTTDDFRAKDFWAETVSNGSYTYYEFVKYKQPEDNIVNNSEEWMIRYQVIPLIRLSEMYLIVMETAELTEANKLYKSYMAEKNALITTDMAREELNAEILNEYRREFWGEGQMFYAYKRLGVKEMMWKTDREVEEKDYIVSRAIKAVRKVIENNYTLSIPESSIKSREYFRIEHDSLARFIKECTERVIREPEIDDPTTGQFYQIYNG